MGSLIHKLFFHQWQRKLVALLTATVIWFFVNHSIISTKTIPSVPIRVINLPTDKTIQGLLPNGFLSKRITLTLSGTKGVIDQLEPGDVEIILDVSNLPNNGIVQITKKNLVSLNPNINLPTHITSISHSEFVIKMSPILTEQIPIIIHPPTGEAPNGYEFIDIWPIYLIQTVSGPQEQVLNLKNQGLELTFNLNNITKEQLDALQSHGLYDEIHFYIPDQWKKINIPFSSRGSELINDPEAKNLQITFLRQQMIPIKTELPIHVFYPIKNSAFINPDTYGLASSSFIQFKNHIPLLTFPLFAANVSQLFLEIIKDNIEIDIVAAPPNEREYLEWDTNLIDETHLEDTYVAFLISNSKISDNSHHQNREREKYFRQRFRLYLQRFALYVSPQYKLELQCKLEDGKINVHIPNASSVKWTASTLEKPL
jgi:hypothetical protein